MISEDYIEIIENSLNDLLEGKITTQEHMLCVNTTIKKNFIDGRCTACGSINGMHQYWDSGNHHISPMYLCQTCMKNFVIEHHM
jgi:hypothetical protein